METINNIYAIYTTDGKFLCVDSLKEVAGIMPDLVKAYKVRVKKFDNVDDASTFLRINNARRQIMMGKCDGDEPLVDLPQINSLPYGVEVYSNKKALSGGRNNE
ncbi:hypothetical protein [Pectinatus frisingensis]|uniref:hypothetical protein n=2 Tax=Pectinatus frisingensis TaxID=865 RepID=UPI0018C655ED|nr:hypothetical protein [Pectinatus frisingensis]